MATLVADKSLGTERRRPAWDRTFELVGGDGRSASGGRRLTTGAFFCVVSRALAHDSARLIAVYAKPLIFGADGGT